MFDLVFDALSAWNQIGLLVMALVFILVGGAIAGYELYWRVYGQKIKGRVKAVYEKEGQGNKGASTYYYAIYEYKAPNGEIVERKSDVGSGSILGRVPGSKVDLLMMPTGDYSVRKPMAGLIVFGLVFLLPGLYIGNVAVTRFEFNYAVVLMALAGFGFIGYKIFGVVRKIPLEEVRKGWAEFKKEGVKVTSLNNRQSGGRMLEPAEIKERVQKQVRHSRIAGYMCLFIALGLGAGGYYAGQSMQKMLHNGLYASGEVVGMERGDSSDSVTYSAIVRFTDDSGRQVKFTDSVGSSHPTLKRGDNVEVLYLRGDPEDAIVDRGLWNWGVSGGLLLFALLLLWGSLHSFVQVRRHSGTKYRDRV